MKRIILKRVYDDASQNDGYRMLIDRVWPRGVSKEDANLDEWNKEIAPSTDLRKWFDHDDEKFDEFKVKYKKELKENSEDVKRINKIRKDHQLCLLFGAKNEESNQAVVLKEYLENN
ncbi:MULTISPECIES: DUF488 domain-containing protein [Psychroflexus]|uniref:Uncharacterized conserved protein YeaO, DUF488 family n=1 Tax=Psychroflexus halocasei TaxID=908615 RepID=A0A1H3ZNE1_9FLAO|nr:MULTISPECIES: DUF488 family protein [Psychroflexus]PJX25139.1 hypothetical protein CAP47_02235 [Psychroflexus sp. S27]SEA25175.1 Uncharacterized conserved protein YeaO, DUF488 family [Psychroflexus halocasei]